MTYSLVIADLVFSLSVAIFLSDCATCIKLLMSTGAASTVSKHSLIDHYSVRMMLLLNETVMLLLLLLEVLMALVHLYWCKS